MFTVVRDPQFVEDVTVPSPDGTGWETQILRTRFRMLPDPELQAILKGDAAEGSDLRAFAERAVVGFTDLVDDTGAALDGTGEWRDRLLDYRHVQLALLRGYSAAVVRHAMGNFANTAAAGPPGR